MGEKVTLRWMRTVVYEMDVDREDIEGMSHDEIEDYMSEDAVATVYEIDCDTVYLSHGENK